MKKDADTKRIGGYIVASAPRQAPPEGPGAFHVELARWYLAAPGQWTVEISRAWKFSAPGEALLAIRDLRERVMGVEFALVPAYGLSFTRALQG